METTQTFQALLKESRRPSRSGVKVSTPEAHFAEPASPPDSGNEAKSLDALLAEGQALFESGEIRKALASFQVATKVDPKSEEAWLGRAKAAQDPSEAAYALGQALTLNPQNLEVRKQLLSLQIRDLRQGVYANAGTYRENPLRRFIRPALAILGILIATSFVLIGGYYAVGRVNQPVSVTSAQGAGPTQHAAIFPPTWTPQPTMTLTPTRAPTSTPLATPTPKFVTGQTNGAVNARIGPGTSFSVVGNFLQSTVLILLGRSPDGKFYQVRLPDDSRLLWVSSDFVDVTNGDGSKLPEVIVPTPRPPVRPTSTAVPPPPPPPQSFSFFRSKNWPNPHGPQCSRWNIHGTVWSDWRKEPQGAIAGMLVRVWINGVVYGTDFSGSHGAGNLNPGYWEVDFQANQQVNGVVAVVNPDGWLLSPQYPFELTADCSASNSVNEIIIDFSH